MAVTGTDTGMVTMMVIMPEAITPIIITATTGTLVITGATGLPEAELRMVISQAMKEVPEPLAICTRKSILPAVQPEPLMVKTVMQGQQEISSHRAE